MTGAPEYNALLNGSLYIGNLPAAQDTPLLRSLGVTHVVSVCPDLPTTPFKHLSIPIEDSEYTDILAHFPDAVAFIEDALAEEGSKVFVHCRMGISRSATVLCAYLMKTRRVSAVEALRSIQKIRPRAHPNYGFIKQLSVYEACAYAPTPSNPAYRSWKRRQRQDILAFLNLVQDTVEVVPNSVYLSSDLPDDAERIECLLIELGISHVLSLAPAATFTASASSFSASTNTRPTRTSPHCNLAPDTIHLHIPVPKPQPAQVVTLSSPLLCALPSACEFIRASLFEGGRVLIYCEIESRACAVACAHLMQSKRYSAGDAILELERALPLFNPTKSFTRILQLFDSLCESEARSNLSSRSASSSDASSSNDHSLVPSSATSVSDAPPQIHVRPSPFRYNLEHETDESECEEDVQRIARRATHILTGSKLHSEMGAFTEALMKLSVQDQTRTYPS